MKASELREHIDNLINLHGDEEVLIDCGTSLREIEDIDMGASDEGIVIWAGDKVEG